MKYMVYQKGVSRLLLAFAVWNLGGILGIYAASFDKQKEATVAIVLAGLILVFLNVVLWGLYKTFAPIVSFESNSINCSFLNRIEQFMLYSEVREYGLFSEKGVKFIYISKLHLSEAEVKSMFKTLKKAKTLIVLEYREDVYNYLKDMVFP